MAKNAYEAIVGLKTFTIMPGSIPACLEINGGYSTNSMTHKSIYSQNANALTEVSLNRVITKALYRAVQAYLYPDIFTGFGECDGARHFVGEYQEINPIAHLGHASPEISAAKYALCVYNAQDGTFMIGEADQPGDNNFRAIKPVQEENILDTTFMVYSMMSYLLKDTELQHCFETLCENYEASADATSPEAEEFKKAMYVANDNIICRLKKVDSATGKAMIVVKDNAMAMLNAVHMKSGKYVAVDCVGKLSFFGSDNTARATSANLKKKSINDLRGMFAIPGLSYTEEEQKMIPVLPESTVVSDEALDIAKIIQTSTDLRHPKRNFCLFGPSGLGKTTITQQVAVLLGMPYLIQGCNADTDASDLVVQAVPVESGAAVLRNEGKMPSAMDIAMMPAEAYKKITGEEKTDATEGDCFAAMAKMMMPSGNGAKVRYERANIIKGITKPYLVEVQEPSTMQKQGALTVLNSLMDDCRQITLPSGETILRDPNSVIIMTTNMGYEGTRDLNQSVLSRCRKVKVDYPTKEKDIVDFLLKATDMTDKNALKAMVKVFMKIREICDDNGINQGSYGYRELIDWCDDAVLTAVGDSFDLLGSCKRTLLLSAAVNNADDIIELSNAAEGILGKM